MRFFQILKILFTFDDPSLWRDVKLAVSDAKFISMRCFIDAFIFQARFKNCCDDARVSRTFGSLDRNLNSKIFQLFDFDANFAFTLSFGTTSIFRNILHVADI